MGTECVYAWGIVRGRPHAAASHADALGTRTH